MTKETESSTDQVSIKYIDALNDRDRAISLIEDLLRALPHKDPNENMEYMLSRGDVAAKAALEIVKKQEILEERYKLMEEEEERIKKLNNSFKNTQGDSPRPPQPIEEVKE